MFIKIFFAISKQGGFEFGGISLRQNPEFKLKKSVQILSVFPLIFFKNKEVFLRVS